VFATRPGCDVDNLKSPDFLVGWFVVTLVMVFCSIGHAVRLHNSFIFLFCLSLLFLVLFSLVSVIGVFRFHLYPV